MPAAVGVFWLAAWCDAGARCATTDDDDGGGGGGGGRTIDVYRRRTWCGCFRRVEVPDGCCGVGGGADVDVVVSEDKPVEGGSLDGRSGTCKAAVVAVAGVGDDDDVAGGGGKGLWSVAGTEDFKEGWWRSLEDEEEDAAAGESSNGAVVV